MVNLMNPDIPTFKVCVMTNKLNFELEWMNISSKHSNSYFAHSFGFYCFFNFAKSIDWLRMVSLWCELLFQLNLEVNGQWITITISWAKSELECPLLIFIHFNSKSFAQVKTLNAGTSELIWRRRRRKKNTSKLSNISFAVLHFSHQTALTKLSRWS